MRSYPKRAHPASLALYLTEWLTSDFSVDTATTGAAARHC